MIDKKRNAVPPAPAPTGVAAVNRALSILSLFGNTDARLSLAEISRRTGMYKSTILRLTDSLAAFEMLVREPDGTFRLGVELIRLGALARRESGGATDITRILGEITESTGESATYYVRRGDSRLALYRIDSPKSVRDHIRTGDLLPLDKGAAGRVLLKAASGPDTSASRSVPDYEVIVSFGERDPDVAAVAGPVYSGRRVVGALSISGPVSRFSTQKTDAMSALIQEKCKELSGLLDSGLPPD